MREGLPALLIILSCIALIGMGYAGLLVSQAQVRERKRADRQRDTLAPYRQTAQVGMAAIRPPAATQKSLAQQAAGVFGFDPAKQDQYPTRWWIVLVVTLVLARAMVGFGMAVLDPLVILALPLIWVGLCRLFFSWVIERRRQALLLQFPDALGMMVRSIRVGVPVLGAIAAVARESPVPTSLEFTRLLDEVSIGMPVDQAVREMSGRNNLPEYRFFATTLALQAQTGGGLTETLENLADVIRKRLALKARGHALSSEARTSAMILGCLPIVVGAGIWAMNPDYMGVLLSDPLGRKIFASALGSLTVGGLTMRAIIRRTLA